MLFEKKERRAKIAEKIDQKKKKLDNKPIVCFGSMSESEYLCKHHVTSNLHSCHRHRRCRIKQRHCHLIS